MPDEGWADNLCVDEFNCKMHDPSQSKPLQFAMVFYFFKRSFIHFSILTGDILGMDLAKKEINVWLQ
jgi:hypothetical protein